MTRRSLNKQIAAIPAAFLWCRSVGHSWTAYDVNYHEGRFESILKCPRCETLRHQFITKTGKLVNGKSYYEYPLGYLITGLGRLAQRDREHIRLFVVETMLETFTHGDDPNIVVNMQDWKQRTN